MKINNSLDHFLRQVICVSTSLKEAVRMVAVMELIFALGYLCHGAYLCASEVFDDKLFGTMYLFSALVFWTLTWLLWMLSEKPSTFRCQLWIFTSLLAQFLIIGVTTTRNAIGPKVYKSAVVWILSGIFLQFYMIMVIWAFMVEFQNTKTTSSLKLTGNTATEKEDDKTLKTPGQMHAKSENGHKGANEEKVHVIQV